MEVSIDFEALRAQVKSSPTTKRNKIKTRDLPWLEHDWKRFVPLYLSHDLLWNPSNTKFGSKEHRQRAVRNIVSGMGRDDFTVKHAIDKINVVRSRYSKELRHQLHALKEGKICWSKWLYFDEVDKCLRDIVCRRNEWENLPPPPPVMNNETVIQFHPKSTYFDNSDTQMEEDFSLEVVDDDIVESHNSIPGGSILTEVKPVPPSRSSTRYATEHEVTNNNITPPEGSDEAFCDHLKYLMRYIPAGKRKMRMHVQIQQLVLQYIDS